MTRRGRGRDYGSRVRRWDIKINPDVIGTRFRDVKGVGFEKVQKYQADFQFLMDLATKLVNKYPEYYNKMHDLQSYLERIWYFVNKYRGEALKKFATAQYLAWRYRGFDDAILREGAKALGVDIADPTEIASALGLSVSQPKPCIIGYSALVLVTNQTSEALSDYAVKVTIPQDPSFWDYMSPTGDDIYFTDALGNPLYYFIDEFDPSTMTGIVWVKVPDIPAGGVAKLYMYFGGFNKYPQYRTPFKTFLGYARVWEHALENWVVKEETGKASFNVIYDPIDGIGLNVHITSIGETIFYNPNSLSQDVYVEALIKLPAAYESNNQGTLVARYNPGSKVLQARLNAVQGTTWYGLALLIKDYSTGVEDWLYHTTAFEAQANVVYKLRLWVVGAQARAVVEDSSGNVLTDSGWVALPEVFSGYVGIGAVGTINTQYYDNFLARPYVSPEPTVTVGQPVPVVKT